MGLDIIYPNYIMQRGKNVEIMIGKQDIDICCTKPRDLTPIVETVCKWDQLLKKL